MVCAERQCSNGDEGMKGWAIQMSQQERRWEGRRRTGLQLLGRVVGEVNALLDVALEALDRRL
jgi:hypothetical protein